MPFSRIASIFYQSVFSNDLINSFICLSASNGQQQLRRYADAPYHARAATSAAAAATTTATTTAAAAAAADVAAIDAHSAVFDVAGIQRFQQQLLLPLRQHVLRVRRALTTPTAAPTAHTAAAAAAL